MKCNICPRECGADRKKETGVCGMPQQLIVARAAKHFWEEPPISGTKGSGTVFFSGCSLGCVFCQNYDLSHKGKGKPISEERLLQIFAELTAQGVHNINLVNPTHYTLQLKSALEKQKPHIPVVYNSSGYEKTQSLKLLDGLIDIYLPDFKYIDPVRSLKYSGAENYPLVVIEALKEMRRQCPEDVFDENGIMQKGMIIRHLILPKNTNQSLKILDTVRENFGTEVYISLMSQYTPMGELENMAELQRKITQREYEKVIDYALDSGFSNIFTQEMTSAKEEFIPAFDFTGV